MVDGSYRGVAVDGEDEVEEFDVGVCFRWSGSHAGCWVSRHVWMLIVEKRQRTAYRDLSIPTAALTRLTKSPSSPNAAVSE